MHSTPIPVPRSNTKQSGNTHGQQPKITTCADLDLPSPTTGIQSHNEPLYATINQQCDKSHSEDGLYSPSWQNSDVTAGTLATQGEATPPPKPPRLTSQDAASSTSGGSENSHPPSYRSRSSKKEDNSYTEFHTLIPSSNTNTNLFSKLKAKLGYPIQQRAFVIFSTALVTFLAAYTGLMSKHLKSISNFKNPSLYIPIIIASVLAALSIVAFILNFKDTRIKKTSAKGDSEIFSTMKGLENEKCIKSIELQLSNNTNYIFLDSDKYKYKTPVFKKLELTLKRPLISAEIAAFVTITATYLLTKYFEIGYENLANSLENFNTGNAELMAFTITAGVILALFMYSFIHYYRKTYVEKLEIVTDHKEIVSSDNGIKSYNEKYVEKVKAHYKDNDSWSSGKHNLHKAASLTIDQAEIECYNDKTVIIVAA